MVLLELRKMKKKELMKIAVVGAGPAGIFTARALRRRFGETIQVDLYGDPEGACLVTLCSRT